MNMNEDNKNNKESSSFHFCSDKSQNYAVDLC